jgi:hypothetical protein
MKKKDRLIEIMRLQTIIFKILHRKELTLGENKIVDRILTGR